MPELSSKKVFVADLLKRLEFPEDSHETFLSAMDKICEDKTATAWFESLLEQYEGNENCDYPQMLAHAKKLAAAVELHEYTVSLLMFLIMAEKLLERYKERGFSEELWLHSLRDLRYKIYECRNVHGVNGSFVSWWFPGFYKLTRFAFCRLQFEIVYLPADYTVGGKVLKKGSKAINMHIPNTGTKLAHDEVLESYKQAAEWFKGEFEGEPIVFVCNSWLLSPWHKEVLPATANLVQFFDDFKLVDTYNYSNYNHLWLLFNKVITEDTAKLPQDSTLRRLYVERMKKGEVVSSGKGLFIYDNGKIIND